MESDSPSDTTRPVKRTIAEIITTRGFTAGTDLENSLCRHLSSVWSPDDLKQQYPIEGYRLDFAWPAIRVCVEADGWHHYNPDVALRDALRDSALRQCGWLTFRIDRRDGSDIAEQVTRASQVAVLLFEHYRYHRSRRR